MTLKVGDKRKYNVNKPIYNNLTHIIKIKGVAISGYNPSNSLADSVGTAVQLRLYNYIIIWFVVQVLLRVSYNRFERSWQVHLHCSTTGAPKGWSQCQQTFAEEPNSYPIWWFVLWQWIFWRTPATIPGGVHRSTAFSEFCAVALSMVWLHGKSKLDMDFTTNKKAFRWRFSLKPIQWGCDYVVG